VQGPLQNGPPDKARLIIFREWNYVGALVSNDVKIDGKVTGTLSNGSFLAVDRESGFPQITIVNDFLTLDFQYSFKVEAGKTYFLQIWPHGDFGSPAQLLFNSLVSPEGVADFCGPSWCLRNEDAAESLPKLRSLTLGSAPKK